MIGQRLHLVILTFILLVVHSKGVMQNFFRHDHESNTCNCVGDTLTFECTVMTGRGTIWRGSTFNCASTGNEIILLNSSVGDQTCNSGMITGRVIKHERNNYTSQLHVVFSTDLIGRSIECASDNGSQIAVFNTILDIRPLPPPDEVSIALVNFGPKEIIFSWSPIALDCPSIHYNILASNCGSCPTTTNHTNVTCTDVPTDDSMCSFAIETAICGNITGNRSKPLTFNTTIEDPLRYPFLNFADPNLRPVNFSWSPVTPDCVAIHYNILASGSNCVSCPTTIATDGYSNIACTEISTDNNTCVFAVRSVVCGKITGNAEVNNEMNSRCTGEIAIASTLAIVLTISVIVFTSIIIIVLVKANKKASRIDLATWRRAHSRHEEEDPGQQPLTRRITAASESKCTAVASATIYDEIVKVENIAYDKPAIKQIETNANKEHVYAQIQ